MLGFYPFTGACAPIGIGSNAPAPLGRPPAKPAPRSTCLSGWEHSRQETKLRLCGPECPVGNNPLGGLWPERHGEILVSSFPTSPAAAAPGRS